jgi:hypothetical protein
MEKLSNSPKKPENANDCYALAFNSKNIELLISLYDDEAKLIVDDIEIIGKENIKISPLLVFLSRYEVPTNLAVKSCFCIFPPS